MIFRREEDNSFTDLEIEEGISGDYDYCDISNNMAVFGRAIILIYHKVVD